jgi:hypothetical protein
MRRLFNLSFRAQRGICSLSFRAQRGICFSVLCAALVLPAHAQMRGAGQGFSSGHMGRPHRGVIIGNRGFVSRPFHHQRFFSQPSFPLGVAVPLWWDEPDVVEVPPPPPQPIIVVVERNDRRDEPPMPAAAQSLIIEREGDRYVQRAANEAAPPSQPQSQTSNAPAPVLVLRSGEQFELTDYAITTDALYDLRGGRTKKIELADINLPATEKANEARGVQFALPFITR